MRFILGFMIGLALGFGVAHAMNLYGGHLGQLFGSAEE